MKCGLKNCGHKLYSYYSLTGVGKHTTLMKLCLVKFSDKNLCVLVGWCLYSFTVTFSLLQIGQAGHIMRNFFDKRLPELMKQML